MDKKVEEKIDKNQGFIKVTENPISTLTSEQKVLLNRKANQLFNEGKFEDAKKIFIATGYSDGLTRIGDLKSKENKELEALKMYQLAHNKRNAEPIIEKISKLVSLLMQENGD